MAADYDAIYAKLLAYAKDAHHCLVVGFQYDRILRLNDNITWSEHLDGEDILFEASVCEKVQSRFLFLCLRCSRSLTECSEVLKGHRPALST